MGRPREFDEASVLAAAADAFWSKGYEGTSTRDLVGCTGLTSSSIYAAFGDKRTLFERALDHYLNATLREKIQRLEALSSPSAAITSFFEDIIEKSIRDTSQRGCLLVNSTLEASPDDPQFRAALAQELTTIEHFFSGRLLAAQRSGEIGREVDIVDAARHLLTLLLGLRVLARIRPEETLLVGAVRQGLGTLGLTWPPANRTDQQNPSVQ